MRNRIFGHKPALLSTPTPFSFDRKPVKYRNSPANVEDPNVDASTGSHQQDIDCNSIAKQDAGGTKRCKHWVTSVCRVMAM